MNNFNLTFTKFMNTILKILLPLIILLGTVIFFIDFKIFNIGTIIFTFTILISLTSGYKIINSNLKHKTKIYFLILMSALLRILWLKSNDNAPYSDFLTMYDAAGYFVKGSTEMFKGHGYMSRFPHFTFPVLYMSFIRYLFPQNNILVMKIINLLLNLTVLIFIYLIVKDLFNDTRKALYSLLIGCVFPPFITYTSVYCGENLAMPFYLLSIYLFLKALKKDKSPCLLFVFSSISLAIGNLFRMIATVILIAYLMYIVIYYKTTIYKKLLRLLCTIVPYILVIACVSFTLKNMDITENHLWKGAEPKITNVLKGTNFSTLGMWNEKDAILAAENLDNTVELERKCKEIIHSRLTTTPPIKLAGFYILKFSSLWCVGDFSGSHWTQLDMPENKILFKIFITGSAPFQLFHLCILLLTFLGLFNIKEIKNNSRLNLLYLIFGGYIATYLITENQCRYGYIVCWLFIIFSITGIENLKSILNNNTKIKPSFI